MTIELVAVTALFAAAVQALAGIGFALILTPVLFLVMTPASAIVTATVLGILLNLLILFGELRRPQPAWSEVLPVLAAAVPGAVGGVVLLAELRKPVLQVIVGVSVIAAGLLRTRPTRRVGRGGTGRRLALGATIGALSTSTGINGPPLALWLSAQGLSPARVRDSLGAALLGLGVIAVLAVVPILHTARFGAVTLAAAAAGVIAGHAIGSRLFPRLRHGWYESVLVVVILASGAASLYAGLTSLAG
ncbi:MAG TPA: sulfite exporter TauE/SafE family protein [Solirubrobacteraceae bacterium]|nr:sulfite exporter TauE/SafE family protein [Solirubrobacteraceae bacterium]